jgi:hypothetical protein
VLRQGVTQRLGRPLIEQYAHLCGGERTACGMIEHRANLLQRDPGKPIDKLRHQRAVFKILKEGGHGHARAAKHPRAADAFWVPLDGRARRPIDHEENGTTAGAETANQRQHKIICRLHYSDVS